MTNNKEVDIKEANTYIIKKKSMQTKITTNDNNYWHQWPSRHKWMCMYLPKSWKSALQGLVKNLKFKSKFKFQIHLSSQK